MSQPNFTLPHEPPTRTPAPTPRQAPQTHSPHTSTRPPMGPPNMTGKRELEPIYQSPEDPPSNKGVMIGVAACGAALLLFGLGIVIRGSGTTPTPAAQADAPAENFFTEQQKVMREAVDMAREAQKMQRERMELLRRQMQEDQEGPMTLGDQRQD